MAYGFDVKPLAEKPTGLIFPVPAAQALVDKFLLQTDPTRDSGLPAHITVLFPFVPVTPRVTEKLEAFFKDIPPFEINFDKAAKFPLNTYLVPRQNDFLIQIIEKASRTFDIKPYGGVHPKIIPHLTLVHSSNEIVLNSALIQANNHGPISDTIDKALLLAPSKHEKGWKIKHTIALG